MKRVMYKGIRILVAAVLCLAISISSTGRAAASERSLAAMLDELEIYFDNDNLHDTVRGRKGDAPFDLIREALLAFGGAAHAYETGDLRFGIELGFDGDAPSEDASRLCQLLSRYANSVYHGGYADGWEMLAETILPLLDDTRLKGVSRTFAEDLYVVCCQAGLSRPYHDYDKQMEAKDFDAYFAAHIAPVNDTVKTRILDAMAFQHDSVLNPPPDMVAVYAKNGKSDCISDAFMDYLLWNNGFSSFVVMLTDLSAQNIPWEGLFDQAENIRKNSDPTGYASECSLALAFPALQEAVPYDLAMLANQFYDVENNITFESASKMAATMPPEMLERLREGAENAATMNPNPFVRWPAAILADARTLSNSGNGFVLISTEDNAYWGVPEEDLLSYQSFTQCEEIAALLSDTATLVFSPADARIGLAFSCTYPEAGNYRKLQESMISVKAYHCYLSVRALDLATGKEIAAAEFFNQWGDEIEVSVGVSVVHKSLPDFTAEPFTSEAQRFCEEVSKFLSDQ